MARRLHPLAAIGLFGVVYALLILTVDNAYYRLIITIVPIWAMMGLSWNLFSGYSGLISFGHAAFFGLGAYLVAIGSASWSLSPWLGIPLAGLLGALAGLVIGLPTFRLRGHYFALAMLAYPLAFLGIFDWLGLQEVALPMRADAPAAFMQFKSPNILPLLALALMLAGMLVTFAVERSPFGKSLIAIKEDEAAAQAAGVNALKLKLKTMMLSGGMAGMAGGLYAVVLLVVTPSSVFGMLVSAQALTIAMFGGVGSLWGPVIGALILVPLSELLHAELGDIIPGIQGVIYGLAIIAVILLAPGGLYWTIRDRLRRPAEPAVRPNIALVQIDAKERPARGSALLEVSGLTKSFGGVHAVSDVSFQVRKGEVLGIIGPNGAGKTTLFNLLNGFESPDAGAVRFKGARLDGRKPSAICHAGVGRTFQVVKPFGRMTVLENVTVGAYHRISDDARARDQARAALALVGLEGLAEARADTLSGHDLRLMELARALAGQPELILMDEPLAGLGASEADHLVSLILSLAAKGLTIVIIEHTMRSMLRLADRFLVLDHGAVIADGAPDDVTRDPKVIEAYLGKKWMQHA